MTPHDEVPRRRFLALVPLAAAGLALPSLAAAKKKPDAEEDVTPAEDLMREHGVLKRILLIYDEAGRRLAGAQEVPVDALHGAADVVRRFVEEYHEKLEEEHLFPRFRQKGKLVDLVSVLERQHAAGRTLTATILETTSGKAVGDGQRPALATALARFVRMYAPHEAREDTVLFPALHQVFAKREYEALGEEFERRERKLFGKDGFEGMVEKVAGYEKRFGIHDLDQFTPR